MLRVLILVAVVVGVALWLLKGRRTGAPPANRADAARKGGAEPAPMVACAH